MPDPNIIRPCPALSGVVDAREIANTVLFERTPGPGPGDTPATLSSNARIFDDLLGFLHGYGSKTGATLSSLMNAIWPGPEPLECGINSEDYFFIACKDTQINLDASASNEAFGFPAAGIDGVLIGDKWTITATSAWKRGVFQISESLNIESVNDSITRPVIGDFPRVQSLPTWIRERGAEGDADDIYSGLTVEDADPQTEAHWLVEVDGRVSVNYFEDEGFTLGSNFEFWRLIGGTGEETPVAAVDGRKTLTTTHRAPCFLALDRPYVSLRRMTEGRDSYVMMTDGGVVSAGLPPVQYWELVVRVTGPAHGPTKDQERHLRNWWGHVRRKVTLYPQWGSLDSAGGSIDVRRHRDELSVLSSERYSTFSTVEADDDTSHYGKRRGGRLLLNRAPRDSQSRAEAYSGQLDTHQDIEMTFVDRPDQ